MFYKKLNSSKILRLFTSEIEAISYANKLSNR